MPSFTLPYRAVANYQGYGDVLMPDPAQDAAVIAAWQTYGESTTTPAKHAPAVSPSSISVRVLNGSGVAGQARTAADRLRFAGFSVAGYGNAPTVRQGASVVTYGTGSWQAAQTVAARVGGPVIVQPDAQAGSTVTLTTGTAFTSVAVSAPAPPAALPPGVASGAAVPPWDPTPC
jgi:hypothetical protein